VDHPTDFAIFTNADLANPGATHFRPGDRITPRQPHYSGKVIILVDETSLSQAEYTAMAFRAARGAKVIGSTTAGADGNVSPIPLCGGSALDAERAACSIRTSVLRSGLPSFPISR
jgi:Peptidase family S41